MDSGLGVAESFLLDGIAPMLRILDAQRAEPMRRSPWDEQARDWSNYLTGLGYVVMQRGLVATARWAEMSKAQAMKLGPSTPSGLTFARVVDHAANTWKHEEEWWDLPTLSNQQQRTVDGMWEALQGTEGAWEYKYVNLTHQLTPEHSLSALYPMLLEWAEAVVATKE